MSKENNIGTFTLVAGTYNVAAADGVNVIAMKLLSGAATVQGTAIIGEFGESQPLDLVIDEPTVISSEDFVDGLIIIVASGELLVITNQ